MNPEQGLWARVLVRALVVTAAGVMALGFFGPGEAVLVAGLAVLTYVLLWLRARAFALALAPSHTVPEPYPGPDPEGPEDADGGG